MNNLNRQDPGSWVKVQTGIGAGTYTTPCPDAKTYQFSFTGFGSTGKPPYKNKVSPGTYTKASYYRPKGYKKNSVKNQYGTPIYSTDESGQHSLWTMLGSGSGLPAIAFDPSVRNDAITDFYDQVRQAESNIALTLGEARESSKMLRAFSSLDKIISLARRARRTVTRNPSLLISNVWLSMKYGWLPLYNDVWNYLNWQYWTWSAGAPITGNARRVVHSRVYGPFAGLVSVSRGLVTGKTIYKCRVGCRVGVQNSDLYNLTRVTSLNPLSIAWELTPFSFVVDWFVDVGGYLQNLEASLGTGLTFYGGYETQVVYQVANAKASGKWTDLWLNPPYNTEQGSGEEFYEEGHVRAYKSRVLLSSFPRPTIPTFKVNMGTQRIMSGASLLRTVLLGRVR